MPLPVQITKIKIAQKELCMSDDEYRRFLSNWGVTSSTQLSIAQADEALIRLEEQGWVPKPSKKKKKSNYDQYANRSSEFATPNQLKLAEILWKIVARNPSDEARDKFIFRQTKIRKLDWLKKPHIEAVLCALEDMYRKLSVEEIARRTDKLIPKDQQFAKENLIKIREVKHG
ncbi:MAG: regulatory protein GemA [Balneola sp.]